MIRILAFAMLFMALSLGNAAEAKRVALVIGNSTYVNTGMLDNPSNDARIVADATDEAGFDETVLARDLTVAGFQQTLRDFRRKAAGADVAMIYYAGHGIEANGKNWLVPIDAELKTSFDLPYEAINVDRLLEALSGATHRVVILDACRENPFGESWQSETRSMQNGLVELEADDYLFIYAAAPGQTAMDGSGINSPFAQALARRLPEPGMALQLLGGSIRDDVLAATGGNQRPYVSVNMTGTPIILVEKPTPPPPPPAPAPAAVASNPSTTPASNGGTGQANRSTIDALMWRGADAAGTSIAYSAYLAEFPQGLFADLAQERIAVLSAADAQAPSSGVTALAPAQEPASAAIPEPVPAPATRNEGSRADMSLEMNRAYIPPAKDEPPLPPLPETPILDTSTYPDCRDDYQSIPASFDRAENINECMVTLDKFYAEVMTPFRQRMIGYQNELSALYTDKVGGNMAYSPATQDGFYKYMMAEHAEADPEGAKLADYRATDQRYKDDRTYLQDRFCFNAGCGGYPVPSQSVDLAAVGQSAEMQNLALVSQPEPTEKEKKKRKKRSDKNCKGARAGGGLLGGLLGGFAADAAGLGKVGQLVAAGAGAVIGSEIACQLTKEEQVEAAEATILVTNEETVGAKAEWKSPTRAGVSGSSEIIAINTQPNGNRCLSITDVAIIDGEETRIDKQMCRQPGEEGYTLVA